MNIIILYLQCWLDSAINAGLSEIFESQALGWHPIEWTARRQGMAHPRETEHVSVESDTKSKGQTEANPHQGYEPYWEGYEAKLEELPKVTGPDYACGEECHLIYTEYGEVCGRGNNYTHKTFENYCQLLNEDCTGRQKWKIAYRGKCQNGTLKPYPTKRAAFIDRAKKYQTEFSKRNPTTYKPTVSKHLYYHMSTTT